MALLLWRLVAEKTYCPAPKAPAHQQAQAQVRAERSPVRPPQSLALPQVLPPVVRLQGGQVETHEAHEVRATTRAEEAVHRQGRALQAQQGQANQARLLPWHVVQEAPRLALQSLHLLSALFYFFYFLCSVRFMILYSLLEIIKVYIFTPFSLHPYRCVIVYAHDADGDCEYVRAAAAGW